MLWFPHPFALSWWGARLFLKQTQERLKVTLGWTKVCWLHRTVTQRSGFCAPEYKRRFGTKLEINCHFYVPMCRESATDFSCAFYKTFYKKSHLWKLELKLTRTHWLCERNRLVLIMAERSTDAGLQSAPHGQAHTTCSLTADISKHLASLHSHTTSLVLACN